jgi:hypothetical protein
VSAVRLPTGPGGTIELHPVDEGAVGRIYGQIGYTRQMGAYDPPKLGQISRPSALARRAADKAKRKAS